MEVTRELLALIRRHLQVFFYEVLLNLMKADKSVEMKMQRETHQSRLEHLWWQWLAGKKKKKQLLRMLPERSKQHVRGSTGSPAGPLSPRGAKIEIVSYLYHGACSRSRVQRSEVRVSALTSGERPAVGSFVRGTSPTLESSWCNICHPPISSLQLEYTQYRELSQQLF